MFGLPPLLTNSLLSSFLPLLVFLEAPCFLAWWVGVRLLGDKDEGILSTEVIAWGFVMYMVFFDRYFVSVWNKFD